MKPMLARVAPVVGWLVSHCPALVVSGIVAVLAAGCDFGAPTKPSVEFSAQENERRGSGSTVLGSSSGGENPRPATRIVVLSVADADSLNPLTTSVQTGSEIVTLLFRGLCEIRPDLTFAPSLARSWEFSEDRLQLTFHLRDDVLWHDGTPFTAADVEFTFGIQKEPAVKFSAVAWKRFIESCVAVDPRTVRFTYVRAYPDQLADANVGGIVPKHILGSVPPEEIRRHEFQRQPIGTGPYRFVAWKKDQEIELAAFDRYYEGRARIDTVIFRPEPQPETRVLLMKSGQADVITRLAAADFAELASLPHLVGHALADRVYYFLGWNLTRAPFDRREVREALTCAIDRRELVRALLSDRGSVCRGPVAPFLWGHDPTIEALPFDVSRSERLLAAEGWKRGADGVLVRDGKRFSFRMMTNSGNALKSDTLTFVQGMLAKVGVDVIQEIIEPMAFKSRLEQHDFDGFVGALGVGLKMDLSGIWKTNAAYNFIGYGSKELDAAIDEAAGSVERVRGKELWSRIQAKIVHDQPYTFLFIPDQLNIVHRRLGNVEMQITGWTDSLHRWVVSEQEAAR
jgi:peptide/nickel transport system substrate-binding protein